MPKRKSSALDEEPRAAPRRSTRRKGSPAAPAAAASGATAARRRGGQAGGAEKAARGRKGAAAAGEDEKKKAGGPPASAPEGAPRPGKAAGGPPAGGGKQFWLMKAEPESRLENGVDVRFSIDDLAAKTEPEPWDGIRAYAARNNLRTMKKGDLAFFYHSNCKEPGIVGTMEIVREHSPDPPYYDPNSKPSDPRWSVVHVEFRTKFATPITLKELRAMGTPGRPLENMQMLKQSRLSVSRVSAEEWQYLMGVASKAA